jgi:hypothetical protein
VNFIVYDSDVLLRRAAGAKLQLRRQLRSERPLRSAYVKALAALADPAPVITGMAVATYDGLRFTRIALNMRSGARLQQDVVVEIGLPVSDEHLTRWPVSWHPVGHARVLPAFEGELELADTAPGTELTVSGSYRPPLGVVGVIVAGMVGHRVAEASVEGFIAATARRIDAAVSAAHADRWVGQEAPAGLRALPAEHWLG